MKREDFNEALSFSCAPQNISPLLLSLWWDAKGDWKKAHEIVQADMSQEAAWIHAYLHRKEGDMANASYWYTRAGKVPSKLSLQDEWEQLVDYACS